MVRIMPHVANSFVLELFIIFVWAKVFAEVFEQVSLPAALGEILSGAILGPKALQFVALSENTRAIAEIGAIFLLFEIGLETRPQDLIRVGRQALSVALAGVVVPFALGLGYTLWRGLSPHESTFVAATMVATSVGITARVLSDMGVLGTQPARIILGAAVFDDIFGMLVLAVVVGLASAAGVQWLQLGILTAEAAGFAVFMIFVAPHLIHRIRPRIESISLRHAPLVFALAICLGLSVAAEKIGMAGIIGAFFAGLAFAEYAPEWHLKNPVHGITEFLTPFFFFTIGAHLDPSVFSLDILSFSIVLSLLALVSKVFGCGLPLLKEGWRTVLQVGIGMTPRGEVAFIVALIGLQMNLISQSTYGVVVFMTAATTLLSPPFLRVMFRPLQEHRAAQADPRQQIPILGHWRYFLRTIGGSTFCVCAALLSITLSQGIIRKEIVPLLVIPVIVCTAVIFGRAAGFVGSLLSGLIFAFLLFPPLHSWSIIETSARNNLGWMLLAGIAISYFVSQNPRVRP
jgi:Kef-type K+ transport system membrane component KefB